MKRRAKKDSKKPEASPVDNALHRLRESTLSELAYVVRVHQDNSYPMSRGDWAYVTSLGDIYLNPNREAAVPEWEYVLAKCMLHLGMGHFQHNKMADLSWIQACDCMAVRFLQDSRIGTPPASFGSLLPITAKNEETAWEQIRIMPQPSGAEAFSTMTAGRPDMIWEGECRIDYVELLGQSLQNSLRSAVRVAAGLPKYWGYSRWDHSVYYAQIKDWFVSSYPLLGAVAADFKIICEPSVVQHMGIQVAAVCPQCKEIYINPDPPFRLNDDEWKFVFAHEFLHAALCHAPRCESRKTNLWNAACDYVINDWLHEMDIGSMPEFALFEPMFHGLTAEAIYDLLLTDVRSNKWQIASDRLYGDDGWWDTLEGGKTDAFYRSALQRGLEYHHSQGCGFLPAGLVEEIYAINQPPIPWDVALARWFDDTFIPLEHRHTYARPSRRQSATPDIPRPGWYSEDTPSEQRIFGVILDTSGSMERYLLSAALGTIASYSQAREIRYVRVVFCDAVAYDQGIMSPEEIAGAVQIRGRGGTVLQPGIDLLEHDAKFPKDAPLLIITDGACDRLSLYGRNHAFLLPAGKWLPFVPKGLVFHLK